jgi:hypothetical protein
MLFAVSARLLVLAFCISPLFSMGDSERDGRWAILLVGASGEPGLQEIYMKEIEELHSVLEESFGFPREQIFVLFDNPSIDPGLIQYKATRENLQAVCNKLAGRVKKDDLVFVFIEGHGSFDGKIYKFNMVGPDPDAELMAAMLYSIPAHRFIVMNATNSSGGSIPAFSQEGKIVITATKSGREGNLTHIGRFFVDAFKENAADSDKDGRVSILEAFSYANYRVKEYYENERNLQTEHPVLDDNGDGAAQSQPGPENGDGFLARITYLDTGVAALAQKEQTPERLELVREAQELERQIEALKYAKGELPEAEYAKKLEELLLKLARINLELRTK